MTLFYQAIEAVKNTETFEGAYSIVANVAANYGYIYVLYRHAENYGALLQPHRHFVLTNYPDEWMDHYREQDYFYLDPVVQGIFINSRAFYWDALMRSRPWSNDSKRLMGEAAEFGLAYGFAVPLSQAPAACAAIGFARAEKEPKPDLHFVTQISILVQHLYEKHRTLQRQAFQLNTAKLTNRERQVLSLSAAGCANINIAQNLKITEHTVNGYFKTIFFKLNANNRSHAISIGHTMGLIDINSLMNKPL